LFETRESTRIAKRLWGQTNDPLEDLLQMMWAQKSNIREGPERNRFVQMILNIF
jgi:hypothetical protein